MLRAVSLVALGAAGARAAYCHGGPNPVTAKPNEYEINVTAPQFLRAVPNGAAYIAGDASLNTSFYVVHVYGTAYQMGFAHGLLFQDEVRQMSQDVWNYMVDQVASNIAFLPQWLADLVGDVGLDVALDVLIEATRPYTGAYFWEELRGLADGSGADRKTLERIHLIGELTQGDCSMIGAWGKATALGKTLQLRALDWDTDGPFKQFPAVIVYHPSDPATPGAHAFANVGFLAWIGTLSGSSGKMAVSEIGVSFPSPDYFGTERFTGIPFVFLLRDVLEFDTNYSQSVARMENANRTCDLLLGVGDGNAGTFRGFAYSASELFVFDDTNLQPWNNTPDTWHPRFDSVVYWGMDWLCPGYSLPLANQIKALYGSLTPQSIIRNITSMVQTGDVHAAVYDLTQGDMYVSFMARTPAEVPQMAYDRAWTYLNLTELFALPSPNATAPARRLLEDDDDE